MGKTKKQKKDCPQEKKKALNTFKKGRRKDRWNLGTDWYRRICRKAQAILKHQMKTDCRLLPSFLAAPWQMQKIQLTPLQADSVALSPKDLL